MCGIIGYSGTENAKEIILNSLFALEYRGYDSAGMAVFENNILKTTKTEGKVENLKKAVSENITSISNCGIGHTRWATHGEPSTLNAHPHGTENLMLVHNGIIENHRQLKKFLQNNGYDFETQTDTEVAAKLIDFEYSKTKDPLNAIRNATKHFSGSFALGIVFANEPENVYATKKDSPLLLGKSENGNFLASDISAFSAYTNCFIRLNDLQTAKITKNDVFIFNQDSKEITPQWKTADDHQTATQKQGFSHFMLKEINEEPTAVANTLKEIIANALPDFSKLSLKKINRIHITACGTAYHAALTGKYFIEKFARIPVNVTTASEFRYGNPITGKDDIVIVISQSGETADTLAAMRMLKGKANIIAIVNSSGSTIAHEADITFYTKAGTEIAVASTKAFTVQMLTLYILALHLASSKEHYDENNVKKQIEETSKMIQKSLSETINRFINNIDAAKIISENTNVFFIGRGIDSILALEGSLKLKEISYIHSEAYPAGELKHGTISLIQDGTPVVAIATDRLFFEKTASNIQEVKARGAVVIAVCPENAEQITSVSDYVIALPEATQDVYPFTASAALQLLAFHTANILGKDIDKPRNLAKSVTVE